MKKITFLLLNNIISKQILAVVLLFGTTSVFAQTITDVYPTRVTAKTTVTVIGSGFTISNINNIIISIGNGITVGANKYVSSTEMTFEIKDLGTSNKTGQITVTHSSTNIPVPSSVDTIYYIGYVEKGSEWSSFDKITEIYTNWDYNNAGYWKSSWYDSANENTWPNDRHELLAFTFKGVTYSTGVDDALLTSKGVSYTPQNYKAYSTNGIQGITGGANYLLMADLVDGIVGEGRTITSPEILGYTILDAVTGGKNGLDLGTGVTNFNRSSSIRFFSGNGQVGAIGDAIPDLIVTQVAQAGGSDIYYYADIRGNVVGNPVQMYIAKNGKNLAEWRVDLYSFPPGTNFDVATPLGRSYTSNESRELKMLALKLEDFGLNATNIADVNNINLGAEGTSDIAFLAYNTSAFEIKSPEVEKYPVSRYICRIPSTKDVEFKAVVGIEGSSSADPKENLSYQWFKYNEEIDGKTSDNLSITNVDIDDLATYRLKVSNGYGSSLLPVTLSEGGVPTTWNNSTNTWNLPSTYTEAGYEITVADEDRKLIFSDGYDKVADLLACDCFVPAGSTVNIKENSKIVLYNNIVVEGDRSVLNEDDNSTTVVPAGIFTLKNDASLVQINNDNKYTNTGDINVERLPENIKLYDYVYWSSPVEGFNVSNIPSSRTFKWDPTSVNANGSTGDWTSVSNEIMVPGSGYIARVPNATPFTTTFTGVPNTGEITIPVKKSTGTLPAEEGNRDFNLIGNPYPSAINVTDFLVLNTNLDGYVRIWTHNNGIAQGGDSGFYENFGYNYIDSYIKVNGTGSSTPTFNGNIASGQSFFVKLNSSADSTVEFTNELRYNNSENAYNNNEFFRGNAVSSEEKQLLWLNLVNDKKLSQSTLIGYVNGATTGKDRLFDAPAGGDDFKIYSLISDEEMVIQGRSLPFSDADEVPIGIQVVANGSYQIGIDNLKGSLFENDGQDIYLLDTYLNIEHDLRHSPYSFTATAGAVNDRFVLKYVTSTTLSVGEDISNNTYVYIKDATLYVKTTKTIKDIKIFDFSGKRIQNFKDILKSNEFSSSFPFANGGYIVNITLENGNVIYKKLIN
ncbi:T9SS type A sorting domain-containing protein [Formosa sp. 3Alg 14/1]|uniref:T9SS type A sorting domain-containing protein n=1 Tax=Formosa sp. 3Alg 14/1 TaxID=3382190 RepID=UPI0039BE6E29